MARTFSGSSGNRLSVGDVASVDFTPTNITISAWVYPTSTASDQMIFCKRDAAGNVSWQLALLSGGTAAHRVGDGVASSDFVAGATALTVGQWYHVALTRNTSSLRAFVNGKQDGITTVAASAGTNNLAACIGANSGNTQLWTGSIAHVAIWNQQLSLNEMVALSKGADPRLFRGSALRGYWPLDVFGGAGDAPDVSGFASPATLVGSVGVAPTDPAMLLVPFLFFWAAPVAADIIPPFGTIGVTSFEPDLDGPEEIDSPFLTIDVDTFAPAAGGSITPPFGNIGFFAGPVLPGTESPGGTPVPVEPVVVFEGALPPFLPPSLPPTIGGGAGPGGGGGSIPPTGPGVPLPPLSSGGLAGIRFYQGPPWRWVVTDLESNTLTFLDRLAFEAEVKYILNRTSTARLSVPADNPEVNIDADDGFPFVDEGDRLLYGFRREGATGAAGRLWVCRFAGTILQTEDTGLTEDARTILTATDPWQRLYQRPMVNIDGEFPDDAGFFSFNDTMVGTIALTFLRNTIINHGEIGIDMGDSTPAWSEDLDGNPVQLPGTSAWGGPYGQLWGAERFKSEYEDTTQIDTSFQQGMSVGEVWDQLIQTGLLDIVLTPIYDPINRPGYTHEVAIYERVGDPADNAVMGWDKPSSNLVRINHIKDGYKRANTVRYHEHQGGPPVGGGIPISYGPSILRYGEYWATQFFPGRIEAAALAFAELQLELRANGIDTVQIEPTNERAPFVFTEWFLGDTVPIFASAKLREAIAGFQRVYGITLRIDENSYEKIPQVAGSPET